MKKILVFLSLILALSLLVSPALAQKSEKGNLNGKNIEATTSPVSKDQSDAREKKVKVSDFIKILLKTADREKGGLGEEVRSIAREQEQAEATTTEALRKVELRSKIKTFLFGSDYKNLGVLRSQLVQTRNRLKKLADLVERTETASTTATSTLEIKSQIQTLEEAQTKMENFIKAQEGKISLFGWLVKLFNK